MLGSGDRPEVVAMLTALFERGGAAVCDALTE